MCRTPPEPVEDAARNGSAIFVYYDWDGAGIEDEKALALDRLGELGYVLRCTGTYEGSGSEWSFYDRGEDSHVVKVSDVVVADRPDLPRVVRVSVITTLNGAQPIGSPDYVSDFPSTCL